MDFNQLVKKYERKTNKKSLIELFSETATINKYVNIEDKIMCKYLIVNSYLDKQAQIDALNHIEVADEKLEELALEINKLALEQEAEFTFRILDLYCEGIDFELEDEDEINAHSYNILYSSGLFDYIYNNCKADYDNFCKMIDRDIAVGLNNASTSALRLLVKQFINTIDFNALTGLKNEIKDIVSTEAFKELKIVAENIK